MPSVKLTDATVRNLRAPARGRVDYFDAVLPSFGLRVAGPTPTTPGGRKSWMIFYRHASAQKRLTIGTYPDLTLGRAREDARGRFEILARGIDPADQGATVREAAKAEQAAWAGQAAEGMMVELAIQTFMAEGIKRRNGREFGRGGLVGRL